MYINYEAKNDTVSVILYKSNGESINDVSVNVKVFNKTNTGYTEIQTTSKDSLTFLIDPSEIINPLQVYLDIYLDNTLYKSKVRVQYTNTIKRFNYNITYTSTQGLRSVSTPFLRRTTIGLPSWSTSYKEDITNYSKLFYPIYSLTENLFFETQEHLNNNLTSTSTYKSIVSELPVGMVKVDGEDVPITFSKSQELINKVSLIPFTNNNLNLINTTVDTVYPFSLDVIFNKLFLYSKTPCLLKIEGTNNKRQLISEDISCNGFTYTNSINSYQTILSITVVDFEGNVRPDVVVTNYLDCIGNQINTNTNTTLSLTVDKHKDYKQPLYIYNHDTCTINTYFNSYWGAGIDSDESYYNKSMEGCVSTYINSDSDVIYLNSKGEIMISKLVKNLSTDLLLHSSNNNNGFVTVTEDNVIDTNTVEFEIKTKDIISYYGNTEAVITLEQDGMKYYLHNDGQFKQEQGHFLISNKNSIYFTYNTSSIRFVSLVVSIDKESYQASVIKHILPNINTNLWLDKFYMSGKELIGVKSNQLYKIALEKQYAVLKDDTNTVVSKGNVEIINKRGHVDGTRHTG